MNKFRKKYQNVVESKNHLAVTSRDHNTIDSLESQALDGFYVESSGKEYLMQRMGQLYIKPSAIKRRYKAQLYKSQMKMLFPGKRNISPTQTQTLDNFIIKSKQKPKNTIQKPVHFNIFQRPKRKIFREEQLDSFTCAKKQKPILSLQNVHSVIIEKKKKLDYTEQSLNHLKLPATGKFFNNRPILKPRYNSELEFIKIKAPYKCVNSTNLLIPLQPKKTRFTDITSQNSSKLDYIINKVKVFLPSETSIKNATTLLIPQQPKKTSFKELISNKETDVIIKNIPKIRTFSEITIENCPDIFIPEQGKKRYYSAINAETMTIPASERPDFCLEIDPNEEIFIPNVYDMLLIQNYWDDLSIKSFRVCLRPKGFNGKSSQNLEIVSNKNLYDLNENMTERNFEPIKENLNDEENGKDKDVLKEFSKNNKEKQKENNNDKLDNIYEDRDNNDNNKADLNGEKPKLKFKKSHKFRDLKKKMKNLEDD